MNAPTSPTPSRLRRVWRWVSYRAWSAFDWFLASWLCPVAVVAAVGAVVIGGLFGIAAAADAHTCSQQAQAMDRAHRWGFFAGCLVELDDGTWVPIDNYRVQVDEEGTP